MGARLFGSTELAARVERAECELLRAGAQVAAGREPMAMALPIAGGVAVWAGVDSPLDKVAGLGFGGPLDPSEWERVEAAYAARGARIQVELSSLGEPSIGAFLGERGFQVNGFEHVLALALDPTIEAVRPAGVEIRSSGPDELELWLDLVVGGFAAPDAEGVANHEEFPREVLQRTLGDLGQAEGFVRYLARRGGEPAGGGSLRLGGDGVAVLCGAATHPAHLRRGVQSALLAARLAAAHAAGCDLAVVTTQPGSKSQQNVERRGFQLLYARAILVREAR